MPEEESNPFGITPGEALTDSHASGDADTTAYGAARLELSGEVQTVLACAGAQISQAQGFVATLSEDARTLTLTSAGTQWRFGGDALEALRAAGVDTVILCSGEAQLYIDTAGFVCGQGYDALRSRGVTPNVFEYRLELREDGWTMTLTAGAKAWTVSGDGTMAQAELARCAEDGQ